MYPQNPVDPPGIVTGWLMAVPAFAAVFTAVAVAQGLAVVLSGGAWIGLSLPPHLQPWALVNVPVIDFATTSGGLAYWLAGPVVCLVLAVMVPGFVPRPSSMAAELAALQVAWTAGAFGLGWLALVDGWDGHLSRMLRLWDLPNWLVWLAPVVAGAAVVPACLRLLALARAARTQLNRGRRLSTVGLLFWCPTIALGCGLVALLTIAGWPETPMAGLGFLAADPRRAVIGLAPPILVTGLLAWIGYPAPAFANLRPVDGRSIVAAAVLALAAVVWIGWCGAPTPSDQVRSLLWSRPDHRNNIRPWIERRPEMLPLPPNPPRDTGRLEDDHGRQG